MQTPSRVLRHSRLYLDPEHARLLFQVREQAWGFVPWVKVKRASVGRTGRHSAVISVITRSIGMQGLMTQKRQGKRLMIVASETGNQVFFLLQLKVIIL